MSYETSQRNENKGLTENQPIAFGRFCLPLTLQLVASYHEEIRKQCHQYKCRKIDSVKGLT